MPGETEGGSAGAQPPEGYPGQAHQTMRGRGEECTPRPPIPPSDERPGMPQKLTPEGRL